MIVVLCEHGEARPHYIDWTTPTGAPHDCPGGRVLQQAIIIERDTDGNWPEWAVVKAATSYRNGAVEILDALASAQENQQ